jgi:UPF0755 protein
LRRLLYAAVAGVALLALVSGGSIWHISRFLDTPVNVPPDGIDFVIEPGSSFHEVSRRLAETGVISNARLLRGYARWTGQAGSIHAGEYRILEGTTAAGLLDQFTSGNVRLYSFTIIEGWNRWDLLAALRDHPHIAANMADEDWPALLDELGAETTNPEGLFLPETYHFPRNTSDRDLLKQAYALMQTALTEEWGGRDENSPVKTPYEVLILASIVEKETARADERARIAGVFARRLDKRMRLQTDPTVIYGIGPAFNGNLTRRDLQTDTPYNTYTRGGLPPTPIAMPGRDAIRAALHPADGPELYFVATGVGDGSHKFSTTKAEHDAAVAEYLKRLRARRSKGL